MTLNYKYFLNKHCHKCLHFIVTDSYFKETHNFFASSFLFSNLCFIIQLKLSKYLIRMWKWLLIVQVISKQLRISQGYLTWILYFVMVVRIPHTHCPCRLGLSHNCIPPLIIKFLDRGFRYRNIILDE